MKKFLKIFLISFISLVAILLITISILVWLAFTPERLTPIVRSQAEKFFTCQSEIGKIELTFFSTFPDFGLKLKKLALINPFPDAPDTLVRVEELVGIIDASAWMKRKELLLVGLELNGGSMNVFSDSLGNTNYNIVIPDTSSSIRDTESETNLPVMDIRSIKLNHIDLDYNDLSLKLNTAIRDLSAEINGTFKKDRISGRIMVSSSGISFGYKGEKYLRQVPVQFDFSADVIPSRQFIRLKNAKVMVNSLELFLDGTVMNDTASRNVITDLRYTFSSWPVSDILALVPPGFHSYLEGMDVHGKLTSQGSVKGLLNDSIMPLMDVHLNLEKGKMKYSRFPLPLHDLNADVTFYSDLRTDSLSFVHINRFNASTPRSGFAVKGEVNHLFSDIRCDLATDASLWLDEFNVLIPDSLKADLKGKATAKIRSAFSLSHLKKVQLEKMKLSGSVDLSDFQASYDSLSLKTDWSKIEFVLPSRNPSSKNTKFAFATILSDNLAAGKKESYNTFLQNASITLETSDVRDTTRIPDLICSFRMDSLYAEMDTLSIAIVKPDGKISLSPRADRPDQPRIMLSYNGGLLKTIIGKNSVTAEKIILDTDILNDNTQKDIFLQWLVKGFIDINQGNLSISGFSYPIKIPSVKMNFEPEIFNIKESKMQIDKSDFKLTGNLNNILSYFRNDSILRGNFRFESDTTDVMQLMMITSGMGNRDSTDIEQAEVTESDSISAGPYMVPKGIDITLSTDIKTATFGIDTATSINGKVEVNDGIMVLDGLSFKTPAARMQLTAMYRTPRKNHLFLGLDYHMLDVEIGELLQMIPDIDSLMPMLRSFGGKGEFHIAVETYLDSLYNIKKSTLRGASSIRGNNLVLMDGETFSEIAKKLRFSKKTENKVDSLSAEFTIFRNEIDIYPFLIVMDKYKAVIAGRHNFDMSFDYHISVVDCPLPIKLGLDIKGNMDDLSVNLTKCRYPEFYRPASRRAVENKQLELRKMIRDMLTKKVIEE